MEYRIRDIKVFVDGVELVELAEMGISPKDEADNVKPIKDWSGKTIAWALKEGSDAEGSITLHMKSESNSMLMAIASAKRAVQVVITSENTDATQWSKISVDECYFQLPEVKPDPEEPKLEWKFIGTNFRME